MEKSTTNKIMDKITLFIVATLMLFNGIQASYAPKIMEHPIDTVVARHEPVTLNCKADADPPPTLTWYKDGNPIDLTLTSHRILQLAEGLFFLRVVNSRRENDSGVYVCEAKNELGVVRSNNATLQVAVLRDEFKAEPQHTRVAQGETAILECSPPKGTPEPSVFWRKNGQKLEVDPVRRIRIIDGGNLAIQEARQSDEGQYQCVAKNAVGTRESSMAFLEVHIKPFLIRGPHDQTVVEGHGVTFQCRVGGDPMPDVLWRRSASGGNMPLDRVHILEDRSLRLENVILDDEGEYSCEADNSVGSVSATGMLSVLMPPILTIRPVPQIVELPSDITFECKAFGRPEPILMWSIEGNNSLLFPGNKYGRIEVTNNIDGLSTLTVLEPTKMDNGLIVICNAINEVGSISVRARVAISSHDHRPPPIIIFGPYNQTLPQKSTVNMNCKASGSPNPTVTWFLDGREISLSERRNVSDIGTLTITDINRKEDQGLYTCVASNKHGKYKWSGYLKVESPTNPNIQFFRAYESSSYPSSPTEPQVSNATRDSVTLSWLPGVKRGDSDLLGYIIEMYSDDESKGWETIATRVKETAYTVTGLLYGYTYNFIVRAENSHGISAPSPISQAHTAGKAFNPEEDINLSEAQAALSSDNIVRLVDANATDAISIRLYWEVLDAQFVEGFYIYSYKKESNGTYKVLTVLHRGGTASSTITGLERYADYYFFLIPFYKTIEGRPSNLKEARTLEDVPTGVVTDMEAALLNATAVYIKWQPPLEETLNGILTDYHVIIRGHDNHNFSKILTNMTVAGDSPKLLLANLTAGVTYSVSVAAATRAGIGPYSSPSMLRLDPHTKRLDHGYTRFPINHEYSHDILTETWFIILLGSIIAIIVFLFGATVLFRRIQFMKHSSLSNMHGNHAIGTVRKFPTLPLNQNGVWIDPGGGVWRQASDLHKDVLTDYAQVAQANQLPLPDYERLSPTLTNMPDYAEVAGCSTYQNPHSPTYNSSFGAYATTTLVGQYNTKQFQYDSSKTGTSSFGSMGTSPSPSTMYNNFINSEASTLASPNKMNIIENRMNKINHKSSSSPPLPMPPPPLPSVGSIIPLHINNDQLKSFQQQQQHQSPVKHIVNNSDNNSLAKYPPPSPINNSANATIKSRTRLNSRFGEVNGKSEQPLFIKSKYDGSWSSINN